MSTETVQQHDPNAAGGSLFKLPYMNLDTSAYTTAGLISLAERQLNALLVEADNLHSLADHVLFLGEDDSQGPACAIAGVLAIAMQSIDHRTMACINVIHGLRKRLC